jgi:hypothetical protein
VFIIAVIDLFLENEVSGCMTYIRFAATVLKSRLIIFNIIIEHDSFSIARNGGGNQQDVRLASLQRSIGPVLPRGLSAYCSSDTRREPAKRSTRRYGGSVGSTGSAARVSIPFPAGISRGRSMISRRLGGISTVCS